MKGSTLPPLLSNYFPSFEETSLLSLCGHEVSAEGHENLNLSSFELEKKSKNYRAVLAKQRLMEAQEKASKEREEKALHTLKMWNVAKETERKKRQKLLNDRVNLQFELIKKQDQLHEILEKQQQHRKDVSKHTESQLSKVKVTSRGPKNLGTQKQKVCNKKANHNSTNCKTTESLSVIKTILDASKHDKHSEIAQRDTFSEEDVSEFMENSIIENADFHALRHQPLNVQLEKLLGNQADSYLNPTVKESQRKGLNPTLAGQKGEHTGATMLWETLRDFSRQKLRNKDALILPDVKNAYACFTRECLRRHVTPVKRNFVSEGETGVVVNIEESNVLRKVKCHRRRQELMFRIAHVNKEKTKLLFQAFGPTYLVETDSQDGLTSYYPVEGGKQVKSEVLPCFVTEDEREIHSAEICTSNQITPQESTAEKLPADLQEEKQLRTSRDKLVFLTEEKAKCKGQFSKRFGKQGGNKDMITDVKKPKSDSISDELNTTKKTEVSLRLWEPLSMDALFEQHKGSYFQHSKDNFLMTGASETWTMPT